MDKILKQPITSNFKNYYQTWYMGRLFHVNKDENNNHYLIHGFEKKFGFKYDSLYPKSTPKI